MTAALAFLALGLAAGYWLSSRRRARPSESAPRVGPAVDKARPPRHAIDVLRGDDADAAAERDARELAGALRPFLLDVIRQHGAAEATVWRRTNGEAAPLAVVAWTGDGPPPAAAEWEAASDRALVAWSATERMVAFDRREDEPRLAICPVVFAPDEPTGAVVLLARDRLAASRDALRDWLPRHAAHVGRLVSLFSARNEMARQSRVTRALLRIARDLQRAHEPDTLERLICDYAVEVTGSEYALLVRWSAAEGAGQVVACSDQTPDALRESAVTAESAVGSVCLEGTAAFWDDARFLAERGGLLGDHARDVTMGAFAVLPLLRGVDVIGALVLSALENGVLRALEIRNASVLAALAVNALETAWEFAESSRRSRTDPLTGLWNRRQFDEQLERVLTETDRFGGACALVLADLDHFKHINDTHGHAAGDAVLRSVAAALRDGIRTVDLCARIGGEEIALILPQTARGGAVDLAERLRQRIEALTVSHGDASIRVTVSIGLAIYEAGSGAKATLFKRADDKLYEAKRTGRNRVES